MDYDAVVGKIWKTKTVMSNGNIDYGEIKLGDISRFARAERKKHDRKDFTLTPITKWLMGVAIRNFEDYVKKSNEDIKLKSISIQGVKE